MDSGELTIRAARPADRQAMERICATTWEWGDYIPDAWDEWLADDRGPTIVGEVGERVVALSKITFEAPDQVWLEGMRVEPEFRRQGIAGRFLEYSLTLARERGARVARLGTGAHNTPVHIMAARAGMERAGIYVLWMAEPLPGGPRPELLTPEHTEQARAFLWKSPILDHSHGLCGVDWAWRELSPERMGELIEGGQVMARFDDDRRLLALATTHLEADDGVLWMGFVDGEPEAVTKLATAIRARSAELGARQVRMMVPDVDWLRDALRAARFGYGDWEGDLWIFERWLGDRLLQGGEHDG